MSDDEKWIEATDLKFDWSAGEVCFTCPCGAWEFIISEAGESKECDCGRTYKVVHYVAVIIPE